MAAAQESHPVVSCRGHDNLSGARGVKRPLTTLTFRATEFTAGVTGASAMPGDLPPNSGYSYAVDFSFDELAGTGSVPFDQPVINYTENFLGIPVGTPVPAGYYDNLQAKWIPADNGRVIKILSISGGLANLDVTGDGIADTGQILTDLGITDSERQQLAGLYSAGQELWRTPIPTSRPGTSTGLLARPPTPKSRPHRRKTMSNPTNVPKPAR